MLLNAKTTSALADAGYQVNQDGHHVLRGASGLRASFQTAPWGGELSLWNRVGDLLFLAQGEHQARMPELVSGMAELVRRFDFQSTNTPEHDRLVLRDDPRFYLSVSTFIGRNEQSYSAYLRDDANILKAVFLGQYSDPVAAYRILKDRIEVEHAWEAKAVSFA